MRQMRLIVPAGEDIEIGAVGDYVRIRAASVTVRITSPDRNEYLDLDEGDSANLSMFNRLRVSHSDAAEQIIELLIGNGTTADSSRVGGSVNIGNVNGPISVGTFTSTNVSTVVSAAKSRRYLFLQNRDTGTNLYVDVSGNPATAHSLRIGPGESFEFQGFVPTGDVSLFSGSTLTNAITIMEG